MKMKRAETLLIVAIVTSAVVMQIRDYTAPGLHTNAPATTLQRNDTNAARTCATEHNGLLPASCATNRDERSVDRSTNLRTIPGGMKKVWI